MNQPISFQNFDKIYQDVLQEIYKYWTPQMQSELASYNYGWNPELFDFREYLQLSSTRFYKAYRLFAKNDPKPTVCDVGGFWGVFPITLKNLGYDIIMTESLQYYSTAFNDLFKYITDNGVQVIDYDPFQPEAKPPGHFDVITVMAVLEHYPHSLSDFMKNVISIMKPDGKLYIEVPNIAYWPKRINFLYGKTPLVPSEQIFKSKSPFIGHHHEFTSSELKNIIQLSGLSIISEDFYNYSFKNRSLIKTVLKNPLQYLAFMLLKDSRECLAILCSLKKYL